MMRRAGPHHPAADLRPDRRQVLRWVLGSAAAGVLGTGVPAAAQPSRPAPIDSAEVFEFVKVAHNDLAATRRMLEGNPSLVNATWDWGGGDFETALGGASHTGNAEIARYLLAGGARLDLFAAAMLGELDVVRAALSRDPSRLHTPGPHGIPLLSHAKAGGAPARDVLALLMSLGSDPVS